MGTFLAIFLPDFKFEKHEFNKENSDRLIFYIVHILDALFKAENLARKKNFQLPAGKTFFDNDILQVLENITAYLQVFNTQVLSMSKTERQTLVFILENLGDYFKNGRLQAEDKEKKNLFADYKFWIENFFKLFDQKISGAVSPIKTVTPKNLFGPMDPLPAELIYGNATLNFSLSPFVIIQDERIFFLWRPAASELIYGNLGSGREIVVNAEIVWQKVGEFYLANFCFADLERVQSQLPKEEGGFLKKWREVEAAYRNQQLKMFTESFLQLEGIAFEDFNMPLIYLLQIRNLANLNRALEMKRLLQKFLLFYPFYAEGHEMMGDVYCPGREHANWP